MASSITIVSFDEVRFPQKIQFGVVGGPVWSTTLISLPSGFEQRNQNQENPRHMFEAEFLVTPNEQPGGFNEIKDFFMARRGRARGFRFKDHTDFTATTEVGPQFNDNTILLADGVETEFQLAKFYDDQYNPFRRIIKKPVLETASMTGDPTLTFVDANPDTITRGSGSWITDGINAGHAITVDSASNDGTYVIDTITGGGTIITLTAAGVLVAEGPTAGHTVTTALVDPDDPVAQVFVDAVLQTRQTVAGGGDYKLDTTTGKITFAVAPANGTEITWTGRFDVPVRFDIDDFRVVLESFNNFEWPDIQWIEVRIP